MFRVALFSITGTTGLTMDQSLVKNTMAWGGRHRRCADPLPTARIRAMRRADPNNR